MILCFFSSRPFNEDFRRFLAEAMHDHVDAVYHFSTGWRGIFTDNKKISTEYVGVIGFTKALFRLYNLCKSKRRVVYFDTMGGNNPLKAIILRLILPKGIWCFDIFDNLLYHRQGISRINSALYVSFLAKLADIQLAISTELLRIFPRAHCFENAGHTNWIDRSNTSYDNLVILTSIDQRFDFDLVERVAKLLRPSERIHIYGRLTTRNQEQLKARLSGLLSRQPNVIFLGEFRMEDVDRILRPFAIGFTPYAVNSGLTRYINPDKYYLHLNAGMEVISTPIPQAVRMKRLIHIGDSATRIVSLMRALQANKTFRRNVAPTEKTTWRFKAAELTDLIQKKFASGNWQ